MLFARGVVGALLLISVNSSVALADEALDASIHNQWQSTRALGMGNAVTAVARDYQVLLTNPAGLTRLETWQFNGSIDIALTPGSMNFVNDVQSASGGSGTESEKMESIIDVINANNGENHHLRLTPFSGILASKGWGAAFIPFDVSLDMTMNNLVTPAIDTIAVVDTTFAFGMGYDTDWVKSGQFSWGWTGKLIHRGYMSESLAPIDMVGNEDLIGEEALRTGLTMDVDLGVLWTPELPTKGLFSQLRHARPSFGAVLRNALDYGFISSDDEAPRSLGRSLDIGSVWEYPELWIFGGRGVMDFKSIGHENWSLKKGFHAGLEFDWTVSSWWKGHYRVGVNQGYWTAGFSALMGVFNLDFATYGREVGTDNHPQESRVYQVKFNLDF